ncbi:MAG: tRNA (5-methylaminomethyl-2-thiouridine)(34)-methyltransferase MnmD [Bacteroidales bacterium]
MKLVQTLDKSFTVYSESIGENYHSINGAVTESMHVFINAGFNYAGKGTVTILEAGLGTGLNALLTLFGSLSSGRSVKYYAIELYPLDHEILKGLHYKDYCESQYQTVDFFSRIHDCEWGRDVEITKGFILHKINGDIKSTDFPDGIELVYYDAFSPLKQPELWSLDIFEKLYKKMLPGAVLTTYCVKGEIKRTLKTAGFTIEKLPGPPGKREMLRAIKC